MLCGNILRDINSIKTIISFFFTMSIFYESLYLYSIYWNLFRKIRSSSVLWNICSWYANILFLSTMPKPVSSLPEALNIYSQLTPKDSAATLLAVSISMSSDSTIWFSIYLSRYDCAGLFSKNESIFSWIIWIRSIICSQ